MAAGEGDVGRWIAQAWGVWVEEVRLARAVANVVLAGISLRIVGQGLKGPFRPQTIEGIMKTVRALLGR